MEDALRSTGGFHVDTEKQPVPHSSPPGSWRQGWCAIRPDHLEVPIVSIGQKDCLTPSTDPLKDLVRRTSLRTLDAIHLASLLTIELAAGLRLAFVTADAVQRNGTAGLFLDLVWLE